MIKTRLVKLLSHAQKYIIYQVLFQWIGLLCQIVNIFVLTDLFEEIFKGQEVKYFPALGIVGVCVCIRFIMDRCNAWASFKASSDVKRILRTKIYNKVLKLGLSYREKFSSAEIMQLASEGVEQLETYFGQYLSQLFYSLLAPITLFIILFRTSFQASLVLLICVPLIPVSIVIVQKIAKRLLNKYWSVYTGLGDHFLENIQGFTTLKTYQADCDKLIEMDHESEYFRKITMKVLTMQLNSTSVMDIVAYGGAAVGIIVALNQYTIGLSVSSTLRIILLASEFFLPLRLLGSYFHIAMNGMAASDKIFKLLDMEEKEAGKEDFQSDSINIQFNDVSFSYDETREILHKINLDLNKGTFVSLVGKSGCGKSTIAGILTGINTGYTGSIKIGNQELNSIKDSSLYSLFTFVSHNSYIFKGTIKENLQMGKRDASETEMVEVLKKVNLFDFMMNQNGFDTLIEENAANISGGQRQRLAIARALLKDTPIYIFDEATSNIDAESEEMIMNVIHELSKTKTILLISHRLANVVESDQIYLLENGQIIESGNHQDLMKQKKAYYELYTSQKRLENYGEEAIA